MNKWFMHGCVFSWLLLIAAECGWATTNPWAEVKQVQQIQGVAQSIGSYTAGCLSGADSLPIQGAGYQVMRLSRQRFYGHPLLIRFIEKLARTSAGQQWGTLLIGDLGQPRGGPTLTGHRSHQTGLDVDIWFALEQQTGRHPLTDSERETRAAPSVLQAGSDLLDWRQWSIVNERILEAAAEMPEVDRIFVNPSIKRQLCSSPGKRPWLRKIRPWWKHDDHFHVRLKCPADSPHCQSQEPLPAGDGCDASLAWWFSEEAKKPVKKKPEPGFPVLPALCAAVLQD